MFKKLNNWLGDNITYCLSTMAMFYVVCALVLAPLIWQRPQGIVSWMQYGISVFFQGAALPLLGYVSRKSGVEQQRLIKETHDIVMEEFNLIKQDLAFAKEQQDELKQILNKLDNCVNKKTF